MTDLADVVARLTGALHDAGLPVGPDRAERFARAVTVADPRTPARMRACARATLALTEKDLAVIDWVVDSVFAAAVDPADHRGQGPSAVDASVSAGTGTFSAGKNTAAPSERDAPVAMAGSAAERLHHRDFADLSPDEVSELAEAMARMRVATPDRLTRRTTEGRRGRLDLRRTLRMAHRGSHKWVWKQRKRRPRRLVVLCDISGSMEPYARALLQLLYCARLGCRAEIFTFATQLTRLSPALVGSPGLAMRQAGAAAPDWSGGTRIGAALADFLQRFGRRGLARGAVVLIISDGWETGTPDTLALAMQRLSRLAYRIVWANPRTQSPRYQPLVGGMAAAWPYCDAIVSAHSLDALSDLLDALSAPIAMFAVSGRHSLGSDPSRPPRYPGTLPKAGAMRELE
jgi:uncharacterized protein with von Willebrand factor type A (vWA) domain